MKTDRILLILLLVIIIFFLSYLDANILKITKGGMNSNSIMAILKSIEKNIRIYFFISIALLFAIFIVLILDIKKGIKSETTNKIDPFIGIFEKYQEDKKILKEEKEKALLEIEDAKSMYDTLFNNSYIGILLIDEFGRIININKKAKEILNKGDDFPALVSVDNLQTLKFIAKKLEKMKDEKQTYLEFEVEVANKILNINLFKTVKGKTSVFIKDITELKIAERAVAVKKQEEILGEMASYLSHEIKNSLGIIIGYMKMAEKSEELTKIDKAIDESKKLLNMLEEYLNLSKTIDKKIETLNLYDLLNGFFVDTDIEVEIDNSFKNILIKGDKDLLERIFVNLLKNSEQAGAKLIKITNNFETDEFIEIKFSDDGEGISEDYRDKIFLPFFSTKDKGSGMGLSIVKKFLNDMEGNIKLKDSNKGTTFAIDLKKQIS